jgi:SSS family transporter
VAYLGAPGQAFRTDLTYLQYRVALPGAIFVIAVVLLPLFYRLEVFTIYEYLERRFDLKTRLLAGGLFLLLKTTYLGIAIYAPALVLAEMTGLPLVPLVLGIGLLTALYTTLGGMRAVIWTDSLQLMVLFGGIAAVMWIVPSRVDGGLAGVYATALAHEKLRFFDFSFSLTREVTFWGGLAGGMFLMISEFGADQATIQRYLTTSSMRSSRLAVVWSMLAAALVGLSLFLIGTALFVFYLQFPGKGGFGVSPDRVFAKFIVEELPPGVRGLLVAAVLAAAMSTISAVLNSLATVALSDFYERLSGRSATIRQARWLTLLLGVVCTVVALGAPRLGSLLVASTKVTSFFGGSMVGIFLLGTFVPSANGWGAFLGAIAGFAAVVAVSALTPVSWMWYGVVSASTAFGSGALLSCFFGGAPRTAAGSAPRRPAEPEPRPAAKELR